MEQNLQPPTGFRASAEDDIQSWTDMDCTDDGDTPQLTADNQTMGYSYYYEEHGEQELSSILGELVFEPRLENPKRYSALSAALVHSIDDDNRKSSSVEQVQRDSRTFRESNIQFMDPFGPTEPVASPDFQPSPTIRRADQIDDDFTTLDEALDAVNNSALTKVTNQNQPSRRYHKIFHHFDDRWFSYEKCYMGDTSGQLFPIEVPCNAHERGTFPCDGHCLFGVSDEAVSRYACKVPNCLYKVPTSGDSYRPLLHAHVKQHLSAERLPEPVNHTVATTRPQTASSANTPFRSATNAGSPRTHPRRTTGRLIHRREKMENCPFEGCSRNVGPSMRSDNLLNHLRSVHSVSIPRKRAAKSSTCPGRKFGPDLAIRECPTGGAGPQ